MNHDICKNAQGWCGASNKIWLSYRHEGQQFVPVAWWPATPARVRTFAAQAFWAFSYRNKSNILWLCNIVYSSIGNLNPNTNHYGSPATVYAIVATLEKVAAVCTVNHSIKKDEIKDFQKLQIEDIAI